MEFSFIESGKPELLGVIERPLLLWDPVAIGKLEHAEEITLSFGQQTIIEFDGVSILWDQDLWPPAIDSLFLARTLKQNGYCSRPISSIHDVGCGTGFLGIFLAKKNPFIGEFYATRSLTTVVRRPIRMSYARMARNRRIDDWRAQGHVRNSQHDGLLQGTAFRTS